MELWIYALIVVLGIPVFFFRDLAKEEPDNCRYAGMEGRILGFWTAAIGVTLVLLNPSIGLLGAIGLGYGVVGLTVGTVVGIVAGAAAGLVSGALIAVPLNRNSRPISRPDNTKPPGGGFSGGSAN
jgi:hypothetical protein